MDKFQGQEAPVVIVSLARSSFDGTFGEEGPGGSEPPGTLANGGGGGGGEAAAWSGDDEARAAVLEALDAAGGGGSGGGGGGGGGGASGGFSARALAFVLDVRRLNVALSRAQCLAVVVLSPALARANPGGGAGGLAQMRALSFACRLLESSEKIEEEQEHEQEVQEGRGLV